MKSKRKYYVYILRRPDKRYTGLHFSEVRPFYVGKGNGNRVFQHEAMALGGEKSHKSNVIRKLWQSGLEVVTEFFAIDLEEQEAYDLEVELIALYGRSDNGTGILCNHTDGGRGARGLSKEARRKLGQSVKVYFAKPENRERQSRILKAYYNSHPEAVKRMSENHRELYRNRPDLVAQMVENSNNYWSQQEARDAQSKRIKKYYQENPEATVARIEKLQETWDDSEKRAQHAETIKAAMNRPEVKAKVSKGVRAKWEDDEHRAKMCKVAKESHTTPEFRAKLSKFHKERFQDQATRDHMSRKIIEYHEKNPEAGRKHSKFMKEAANKRKELWQQAQTIAQAQGISLRKRGLDGRSSRKKLLAVIRELDAIDHGVKQPITL